RLNRSEPRPWIAVGLRSAGVICLALALAEPQLRQPNDRVTVLFVVDRSQSIPEELVDDPGGKKDQREQRIRRFINNAVARRGAWPRPGRPHRFRPPAASGTAAQRRAALQLAG